MNNASLNSVELIGLISAAISLAFFILSAKHAVNETIEKHSSNKKAASNDGK